MLPVADEARFFHLINCSPEKATVFCSPTSRPNVSSGMHTFDINNSSSGQGIRAITSGAVRGLIDQKLRQYASSAKVIVYCQTKAATQALVEDLGCDAYYSAVSTADDKAERLWQWMEGVDRDLYQRGRVIVATNALGMGIDIPNIRLIIHLEMPRRIGDYDQQSGRAGRDGLPSEAIGLRASKTNLGNIAALGHYVIKMWHG
ncbi:hypothetical protein MRS44_013416 [Fusarium solani]|uniref:uncharacterized protein n=1 Tax=Fusarium solani TaxID=169388 RepID=UPI0032C4784F|nr:hypothetical protein MRS44_013416 [Fusarium solani]